MALKYYGLSIVLGGGLGYALLKATETNESDLVKHLPPYSSEQRSLFRPSYEQSAKFMNQEKPNVSFKEVKTQTSVNDPKK